MMTSLFLRFYIGVLLILFAAWFVQYWVYSYNVDEQNARVVVKAMSGAVRVSRDWLNSDPSQQTEILGQIRQRFEFPVNIYDATSKQFPAYAKAQFPQPDRIVLYGNNKGAHVATRLATADQVVSLGPLPSFVEPTPNSLLAGLGIVLLLTAAAIAVLLRPVARQLRQVERTATAIAHGDFSARVAVSRVPHGKSLGLAFNSMAERIQALLRTQRELLQAVSHDLRTPLAKIRFASDLVSTAKTEAERKHRLESIDEATEELDRLVGELLSYVRMETADTTPEFANLPVADVLNTIVDGQREFYPHLTFDMQFSNTQQVLADEAGFHRAISNLIGNACRFARSRIRISCRPSQASLLVTIEDDGPGIAQEDRERVLTPFVRLPRGHDQSPTEGVGLGLALVARIMEQHGGAIELKASELGGCKATTRWPNTAKAT